MGDADKILPRQQIAFQLERRNIGEDSKATFQFDLCQRRVSEPCAVNPKKSQSIELLADSSDFSPLLEQIPAEIKLVGLRTCRHNIRSIMRPF